MRKFGDGGDGDRRRRRQRAQKLSRRAVEDLPDDNDSSDEEENSAKNENVASSTTSHSARSAKPILPDVGGGAARRRRGRWGGAEVGMVAVTETGDNSMQFEPCHDAPLLSAARTPVVVKTAYDKLTYENMMHHNNEASPPTSAMQMLMREKEDEEKRREQQRRQQQQQRAQQQQHVFQQQQRAEAIRQQYGSQAIASHDTSGPARGVGRVAWTPTKQTTRRRTNNTSFPPSPSMTPTTKDSNNRAGGGDGDEQNQQQLHQSGSALSLASSSSALSLVSTRLEQNKDTFGPFANAVPPSQVTNSAELARAVSIPASHQRTEILGPNSVELPRSDKGKDLYGTILWNRAGKDMAPIGMMSPDGAGPGGDNRGSGGEDGGGASAVAKHVSPSSISERTCIQKFGISYHEIITKLVMEQGVLSEAESRMVLLLLSEPSDETALPETQMRMLRAVVDIEMRGISRPTIAFFRSELAAVASEVAQHTDMVRALAENDVLLAHRGSAGAPSDASASFGVGSMQPTPTAAASSPGFGSNSGHPGLLSPEGQKTLGTALEEVLRQQQQQQQSPLASEVFSPVGGLDSPASGASGESSLSPAVATLVGGAATAALASDLNALALKEREHSKAMLFPVKEELTGEQLSTAENTGNHATEVEGGGSRRGLTLQHGVDDGGEGEQQQQQQQQQQGEEGEGEEEGEEEWPQSVYEAMTMLSPKQHYQHTAMTGSPSHSAFSVASGVSRSSAATSHWDKHDTTKRMMRVPVIDRVMSKVARRISEIPRHKLLGRKQVILLGSGAYNPIHKMHLRMLYIARRYLEERTEFEVLGGLVSPSHATDVRSRYRQRPKEIIPPKHRLAMARAAVGDSTWLTVDPWEITRKRVMDYMSVLDHVQTLFEACFPELPVKLIYLCNSDMMMKLSPDDLRERGFGCLCVCRPQETDRLLHHMGSRWKDVAYVVEDAAILSRELESTTSARVRYLAQELSKEQTKLPHFLRPPEPDHPGPSKVEEIRAMVGAPVAKWIIKNKIGEKMSGSERWTATDKEFELFSGLEKSDQGYEKDARRKPKRLMEKEELLSNPGATQHIVTHKHDFELLC